ncbi:MAG: hypothetical protein MUC48_24045 [Leptolyngbya sp. Prado105]|nr:hypothetical protein [Leptolyngbya sp. Prado105]
MHFQASSEQQAAKIDLKARSKALKAESIVLSSSNHCPQSRIVCAFFLKSLPSEQNCLCFLPRLSVLKARSIDLKARSLKLSSSIDCPQSTIGESQNQNH